MGRKRTIKKMDYLFVKCEVEEKKAWETAGRSVGRDLSNWTRYTLNKEAKKEEKNV